MEWIIRSWVKRENIDIELWWLNDESFVLRRRSDHQLFPRLDWSKITGQWDMRWDILQMRAKQGRYDWQLCRTLEPLWLQWDDNESPGVIRSLRRQRRFDHFLKTIWYLPPSPWLTIHICVSIVVVEETILYKLTFHRQRPDLSKQKIYFYQSDRIIFCIWIW